MIKKILRMTLIIVMASLFVLVISGIIWLKTSPQFGGEHSAQDVKRYQESGHYDEGKFINLTTTNMDMSLGNIWAMLKAFVKGNPNKSPKDALPMNKLDSTQVALVAKDRMIWFGHSAFLLQLDHKNILLDPMLGNSPAPHPTIGTQRYVKELPLEIEKLPQIDVIILSHDHYDHLDYGSIMKLKGKTKQFLVPLGVGAHLKSWGVEASRIKEFNWWDEASVNDLEFAFAPSRHFSGRGIGDNSTTMWGSWIIKSQRKNIYFSGDGGYGPHFKEIGEKYGPFDLGLMECGQYNELWADIHMMPEETAQAAVDVQAKIMMPIHWGSFTLALHDWNEPAIRVIKKAEELEMPYFIPIIGEIIDLESKEYPNKQWW